MIPPAITTALAAPTAATVIKASPGQLVGAILAFGSADATLTIYDNASAASGAVLAILKATDEHQTPVWQPSTPQLAANGITAKLEGTAAQAIIEYH